MKALFLTMATVMVAAGPAAAGQTEKLAAHELTALDGNTARLSSFKGDIVVVNFWASWCAPCRKELPVLDEWHTAWEDRGARVVAISVDNEVRNARRFAAKANLSVDLFHDGPNGLAKALDLPSLPCTFLLDRDGDVVMVVEGYSVEDLAVLRRKVESLLSAAPSQAMKAAVTEGGTQ